MQSQRRRAGHVARMPEHRLPKKFLFGELQHEKHSQGGQKEHFKDTLKTALKAFNVNHAMWEQTVQDREIWPAAVYKGAKYCEGIRTTSACVKHHATTTTTKLKLKKINYEKVFRILIYKTKYFFMYIK